MKLFNRKRRIEIIGFDDKWMMIIGIPLLALIIDLILNNSFARFPLKYALVSYSISIFFSACNWTIFRAVVIFFRKRYPALKDGLFRIAIILAFCFLTVYIVDFLGNIILRTTLGDSYHGLEDIRLLAPIFIITTMMIAIYEAIYFYIKLQQSIRDEEQAKQAVVQAQLDALRNQSQPHFLFNSFNTLRDIIDQESKEDAKEFVDKLSNVYRFILESGNQNLIPLKKEIKFAEAYLYIQKERFGDNLIVNWGPGSEIENYLIAPMSLQLLLENAIKHNVISKAKPLEIHITTTQDSLVVTNEIRPKSTKLPSTKLGLKNIEKRYNLLSDRSIQITNDGNSFEVSIPLLKPSEKKLTHAHTDH